MTSADAVAESLREAVLAFGGVDLVVNNAGLSISKPLLETTEADWDLQHDVMAKGSFLVSREAARVMIAQAMGGDIVYISSKNSLFAGPNNVAYGATKADQAHQVRLLAAELGAHGIRVNGINPDGVVRGSGHLRRWLGRPARRGLRRTGGEARRVLRPAHPAQARGAARARGQRGLRADRRRPDPHDRPAHPGGRRGRGGVPAMTAVAFAAVDLGASSGRVMVGRVGPSTVELTEAHRFANEPVRVGGTLHWDILALYRGVLDGLRRAGPVDGIGIDSWAVDYGLLDASGALLGNPVHYRDARTDGVPERVARAGRRRPAVRDHRAAEAAVQHRVPAGRGGRHAAVRGGRSSCC